jgi:hypothetical protein
MIYIASEVRNNAPATSAFIAKGLTDYTQGRIRDIIVIGKPTAVQIAFSGYKDNIEAFLYAAAIKQKVITTAGHFPIPADYVPDVPLSLPQTIFRLSKKPNADQLKKIKDGLEKYGLEEVQLGKGDPSYVLRNPSFLHLSRSLPAICLPRTGTVEGSAQLEASTAILRIYQCVDLFLAVNTYSYKRGNDEGKWGLEKKGEVGNSMELRVGGYYYRTGYGKDTPAADSINAGDKRRIDDDETEDLTPHRIGTIPVGTSVLVAKPSPFRSHQSWGTPSSVPNKSGLLFPYFQGMLASDTPGLRELVSSHFFRNLGSRTVDARDSFSHLRNVIGTVGSTHAGIQLSHVMKGIDLAMQTQTQLYLLFDGTMYLGFCLLGEEFSIFAHGKWHEPLAAKDLKQELRTLRTHDKSLEDLIEQLKRCTNAGGDIIEKTKDDISSCTGLAAALAEIEVGPPDDLEMKEITRTLARLSLSTAYKTFSVSSITWAIDQLTFNRDVPFPEEIPFHIPLQGWKGIGDKTYQVLASFGTRGPSFRNSKGTEVNIPKPGDLDKMEQKDEKGNFVRTEIIVGEKVIPEAVKDWEGLRMSRSMRMDFAERARGSRNHVFKRQNGLSEIWEKLKDAAAAGLLGDAEYVPPARETKRSFDIAFGAGNFDDVEF